MIRTAVIVITSSYALFVLMVVVAVRRPVPRPSGRGPLPPALVRGVAVTVAGGYLVFILIVLVFHVWVAGERGALLSAVRGGASLTVVAVAAFVLLSWVESRARP